MMIRFSLVAMLLAALLPKLAFTQEMAPGEQLAATGTLSDPAPDFLYRIANLVEEGRYEEARRLLVLPRLQPRPHLEVLFLSGLIYVRQGDYGSAVDEFRLMLARDATLIRPRLELAYALYLSRDYEAASYHFQQVLAGVLPDEVRENVQGYLAAIREQLPSYSFGFDVVNDDNPAQSTSNQTVTIGGRTYKLSTTAPDQTIWGTALSGGAHIPLPGNALWFARVSGNVIDYPDMDNDQTYLQATLGKHFRSAKSTLTFEAGGHQFDYRGQKLYSGSVWKIDEFWQQNNRLSWQMTLQGAQQAYPDYEYLNGWQHTLSLSNQLVQSANSRWQTGISYSLNKAKESPYTYSNPSLYLRYVREWQGGLISGIRWQRSHSDYGGDDIFFGVRRQDREERIELDLVNRNWRIGGFSPRLLLGSIDHVSNIALYEFRRQYLRVGVSREF